MSVAKKPSILVVVGHYLPGYKAGGILRCVVNIVNHLHDEFDFQIVTRDRDLGDRVPYPQVEANRWQTVGNARVLYLAPEAQSLRDVQRIVEETPHDAIYLNSFFDPLCVKVLFNRKLKRISNSPVILTPQGEFSRASLRQKALKKLLFIRFSKMLGLHDGVIWHASGDVEASHVVEVMDIARDSLQVALQLPPVLTTTDPVLNEDSSARLLDDSESLRVVFLSRIVPEKHLDLAIHILTRVRQPVSFDIIGPIENVEYWERCSQLLRKLPSHVTAKSLGPIQPSEVMKIMGSYDLLLFPTAGESYGQVIAESLVSGTPVLISTNTPWRGLESKGLGWDLPLDDLDAFVRTIDGMGQLLSESRTERRKKVKDSLAKFLLDSSPVADMRSLFNSAIYCGGAKSAIPGQTGDV